MTDRKATGTDPPPDSGQSVRRRRSPPAPGRRRFVIRAGAMFLLTLGIAVLFLIDPVQTRFFPRCPFFALTGLKCPGCGTARALHAVLYGRFAEALRFNVALPVLLAFLAYCVIFPLRAQRPVFVWAVLAFVFFWGVARNLLGL